MPLPGGGGRQSGLTSRLRVLCCALLLLAASEVRAGGKVGVGSGLPYGTPLAGIGVELDLGKYAAALGGVGVGNCEAPWAFGLRVSLVPPGKRWRPHITGMHWTDGNGVHVGVDHDVGKRNGCVLTYGLGFGDVQLEGRVGAMIGLGYRF